MRSRWCWNCKLQGLRSRRSSLPFDKLRKFGSMVLFFFMYIDFRPGGTKIDIHIDE